MKYIYILLYIFTYTRKQPRKNNLIYKYRQMYQSHGSIMPLQNSFKRITNYTKQQYIRCHQSYKETKLVQPSWPPFSKSPRPQPVTLPEPQWASSLWLGRKKSPAATSMWPFFCWKALVVDLQNLRDQVGKRNEKSKNDCFVIAVSMFTFYYIYVFSLVHLLRTV